MEASSTTAQCLRIMDLSTALRIPLDTTMVNAAIKILSLQREMVGAEELAQRLRVLGKMDVITYHTLMMGLVKVGQYKRALDLYQEAVAADIKLDGAMYSLSMLCALKQRNANLVMRIAQHAQSKGVKLTDRAYTTLMQAIGDMEGGGGVVESVWGVLEGMKRDNVTPNSYTYSAAIHAVRQNGEEVMRIWDRMSQEGVLKNEYTYAITISALARAGGLYVNKALALYQEMCMTGLSPNVYTYNSVVRAFAETGNIHQAMHVVDMMVEKNTSSSLLSYIPYILEQMHTHNLPVDKVVYGTILDAYRRHHQASSCVKVLNEMMDKGIRPTSSHLNIVFKALKDEGKAEQLYKLYTSLYENPFVSLNGNAYELVVEGLLSLPNRHKEVLLVIKHMDKYGYSLTLPNCVLFIQVLERSRQYKLALGMYKYMVMKKYDFYANPMLNDLFKRVVKVVGGGGELGGTLESVEAVL
eukprot:gene33644-40699_t